MIERFGPPISRNYFNFTRKIYANASPEPVREVRNGARNREMSMETEIELQHLSKAFTEGRRRHRVLNDVSAGFRRGETIAVRGRSALASRPC